MSRPQSSSAGTVTFWLVTAASALSLGCSDGRPERVAVSGVVKIDGVPLRDGFITLVPAKGRSSFGDIDDQGRFTLTTYEPGDGAPIGVAKVEVVGRESLSETQARWLAPKKYADRSTSELEVEITEPTDGLEINLSWDGGKPFVETDG
jgi:hypothetical protein